MAGSLTVDPCCSTWATLAHKQSSASFGDRRLSEWRRQTRAELGLSTGRPIIATGHQTMLWHPGILAKYLVVEAIADETGFERANLVVDQHAGGFGSFEAPVIRADGGLATRTVDLTNQRENVPMALHASFEPLAVARGAKWALPSVGQGVDQILEMVARHKDAPNASLQMAAALGELSHRWVAPMPDIAATALMQSTFARELMSRMADDPWTCAHAYNAALRDVPEAGIRPLLVRDDYVELPIWRIEPDDTRIYGYDSDVQNSLESSDAAPTLLPRALFMTALVRLVMCDVFVHGTGGARYDRAMEQWIQRWLGLTVAPAVSATGTLHLPFDQVDIGGDTPRKVIDLARRAWHNPEVLEGPDNGVGPEKQSMLQTIHRMPYGSLERRQRFFAMHRQLGTLREAHENGLEALQQRAARASKLIDEEPIRSRRTWAFPLYPTAMIDALAVEARTIARSRSGTPCCSTTQPSSA